MASGRISSPRRFNTINAVPLEWRLGDIILDTYQVKDAFTTGGMANVYRVHHREWGIDLAVKSPKASIQNFPGSVDIFVREAETWVNLGLHPHIVSCYYIRVLGSIPRIFMEFVDGGSLLEAIQQGQLYTMSPSEVLARILDIAIQCAWGLHYAHQKGLVHQDVKPANVMLTRDGLAKVTDFGMSQARASMQVRGTRSEARTVVEGEKSILVDTTGMTPAYCSPEQAASRPLSRRTDIWSWAVSILEVFAGGKTWKQGQFALDGLEKYLQEGSANPSIPSMPAGLANLLRACLSHNPQGRPHDMHVVAESLKKIYAQETGQPYPRLEPLVETILADTLNNRAISLVDLGKERDALQLFDQAIRAESTHAAALYNRGLFLWRSAQLTDLDAITILARNLKQQPERWETAYYLTLIHLERGDLLEIAKTLKRAVEGFGQQSAFRYVYRKAHPLQKVAGRGLRTFGDANSVVNAVAISTDGDLVLAGSNDHRLRLWDVKSGRLLETLEGHAHIVRSVAVSPDGRLGLSGGWDQTLRLWDLRGGQCLRVFQGHDDIVQEVAFTPDGKRALSASSDHTLRLWELETGKSLITFIGHGDTVWAVVISPDGRFTVSASFDNTLRIWDFATGRCLSTIPWTGSCTSNLSLSPDGKKLLVADANNQVWLLDLPSGQPVRALNGHTETVRAVQFVPNGRWALSGGVDNTLRLWNLQTGRCLRTFTGHAASVNAIAVCPTRLLAATGSSDQTVQLWWLGTGAPAPYVTVLPRTSTEILELTVQVEKQLQVAKQKYAQGDYPGALEVIAQVRSIPGYYQNPRLLEHWNRIGQKGIRRALRSTWLSQTLNSHAPGVNSLALTPGAKFTLSANDDGTINLWNVESGEFIRQLCGHDDKVKSVALADRANQALSGSSDGTLILWKLDAEEPIKVLSGHTSEVNSVALTHDGRLGLSGSNDNTLRVWDLAGGKCVGVLKGHAHYVRCVAITPDERFGVSAGWDKTVRLWDLVSGDCLKVFYGHQEAIDALAVSPDGEIAITGGLDQSLRLWSLATGQPVRVIDSIPDHVSTLAFSPEGHFAFVGKIDGAIQVWDLAHGSQINAHLQHANPVTALVVSPQGRFLLSASTDHVIRLWQLDWEYHFSTSIQPDRWLKSYLTAFLYRHMPYCEEGLRRSGRPSWTPTDFEVLLQELSYRGYGALSPRTVDRALQQLSRRIES